MDPGCDQPRLNLGVRCILQRVGLVLALRARFLNQMQLRAARRLLGSADEPRPVVIVNIARFLR
ncbi:hypothetical protein SDC9_121597 [bioreactor metagenome]|uniref:Uncharacterized protein n=1 Tax=bioreactor metagenome TaxID=1076179 RepID=A0A645CCE4_9ZZZZ